LAIDGLATEVAATVAKPAFAGCWSRAAVSTFDRRRWLAVTPGGGDLGLRWPSPAESAREGGLRNGSRDFSRQGSRAAVATFLTRLCWLLLLLWSIQFLVVPMPLHAQQSQPPQDVIVLLDTSASMVGQGDDPKAQNIFKQVTGNIADLVGTLSPTTRVEILPFDQGVHQDLSHVFTTRPSRQDLQSYLDGLQPTGQVTWIYESIVAAAQQLQAWRQGQPQRAQALYVYTDGLDNGAHATTWVTDVGSLVKLQHADNPYLYVYYNDLQTQLNANQVKELQSSGIPVVQGFAQINVPVLDFGTFAPGETKRTQVLPFFFTNDVPPSPITLRLDAAGLAIHIEPTSAQIGTKTPNVPVTLYLDGTVPGGIHQEAKLHIEAGGGLNLQGTHDLSVRFQTPAPPTPTQTATATPAPTSTTAPTATATAIPTATPTATPAPTATAVPPPPPPAPPDMTVTLAPAGPVFPLDRAGFHLGWPVTLTSPADVKVAMALEAHGDPAHRPQPFTAWFPTDHPPVFRLMAAPSPANARGCAATHWCNGILLTPSAGSTVTTGTIVPGQLIGNGQQLQLRVVGDGVLSDGRAWRQDVSPDPITGHRPAWAAAWDAIGIGYWIWPLLILVLLGLVSAADTRSTRLF